MGCGWNGPGTSRAHPCCPLCSEGDGTSEGLRKTSDPHPPHSEVRHSRGDGECGVYLGSQARSSLWKEERALLLWKREKVWLQTWARGEGQRNRGIKSRPFEKHATLGPG